MSILSKLKYWYLGGPLPTRVENKDGSTTYRLPDTFEPSAPAKVARWLKERVLAGVVIGIILAVISTSLVFYTKKWLEPTQEQVLQPTLQKAPAKVQN